VTTTTAPVIRAVYPGTFDPFTDGHRDIVDRTRRLFAEVVVLVAVNGDKQPGGGGPVERADSVRRQLPEAWTNVAVVAWTGLTATYCQTVGTSVIVRGVRNASDVLQEQRLAAMNEKLGVTTLLLPARPALAALSSSAVRAATN